MSGICDTCKRKCHARTDGLKTCDFYYTSCKYKQCDELREAAVICTLAKEPETAKLLREAADTIESLRERLQERQHDHPYVGLVLGKYREKTENSNYYCGRCGYPVTDHDSYCRECGGALHESYEQVPEQEKRENGGERESCGSRWRELFGTPERAAHTSWYMIWCKYLDCDECPISDGCDIATDIDCDNGEIALLEWLRGKDETIDEPDTIRNELMDSGLLRGDALCAITATAPRSRLKPRWTVTPT